MSYAQVLQFFYKGSFYIKQKGLKCFKQNSILKSNCPGLFLVAKLLYKYQCPSVRKFVCLSVMFREKRDFLSLELRQRPIFLCRFILHMSIYTVIITSVCLSFATYRCCHPFLSLFFFLSIFLSTPYEYNCPCYGSPFNTL